MDTIKTAIRPYLDFVQEPSALGGLKRSTPKPIEMPDTLLIIDTETSTDETRILPGFGEQWDGLRQNLTFGRCQVWRREGDKYCPYSDYLFYPDDLPEYGKQRIYEYAQSHSNPLGEYREYSEPVTCEGRKFYLRLYVVTLTEFLDRLYRTACIDNRMAGRVKTLIVGFNLPFDLSRLAWRAGKGRGRNYGGFSFSLWKYQDAEGKIKDHPFRPRLRIRHTGKQKAFLSWSKTYTGSNEDESSHTQSRYISFPKNFLDLATLAFALTNEHWGLDSLGKHYFGKGEGKTKVETHGLLTDDYIDYNLQDVVLTGRLANRLFDEWRKHPIPKLPWEIYSPASIAKGYLEAMGVQPRLELQPNFPPEIMGYAMSAYYGGRTECRIRKTLLPVVYLDFTSQYPLVNSLLGLWDFITARRVEAIEATSQIQKLINNITLDKTFVKETWLSFNGIALIQPDGDILPVRGLYGESYQIGLNPYWSDTPQWYAIPDLVASKLLSGKTPKVIRAFRFVAQGKQSTLKEVKLVGHVPIDPIHDDFFRVVIEERQRVKKRVGDYAALTEEQQQSTQQGLKVVANSGAYGIYVEQNRMHYGEPKRAHIYSLEPSEKIITDGEEGGKYFFPPIAVTITSAAHLLLAMLEKSVADKGGEIAYFDTDSAQIVADVERHPISVIGRGADGKPIPQTITALSWAEVEAIRQRFESLNPFNVPGVPALKMEEVNYCEDNPNKSQRVIYNYSICAKRYCVTTTDHPIRAEDIVKSTVSGMGFYLNPVKPDEDATVQDNEDDANHSLMALVLLTEINGGEMKSVKALQLPEVRQDHISTVTVWEAYRRFNQGKPYDSQVKPFNFVCGVKSNDPMEPGTLYTSYVKRPESVYGRMGIDRLTMEARTIVSSEDYVKGPMGRRPAETLAAYFTRYVQHAEKTHFGPDGKPNSTFAVGLLARRPVKSGDIVLTGKFGVDDRLTELEMDMSGLSYADAHPPFGEVSNPPLTELASLSDTTASELAKLLKIRVDAARRFKLLKPDEQWRYAKRNRLDVFEAIRKWAGKHKLTPDDYTRLRNELPRQMQQTFIAVRYTDVEWITGVHDTGRIRRYRKEGVTIRQALKWLDRYQKFILKEVNQNA